MDLGRSLWPLFAWENGIKIGGEIRKKKVFKANPTTKLNKRCSLVAPVLSQVIYSPCNIKNLNYGTIFINNCKRLVE